MPGLTADLYGPSDPLEYSEFCTSDSLEVTDKEINQKAQQFLENMLNIKLSSRTHH
jgi:hypothetical protein